MQDVLPISHPTRGLIDQYWQNIALNWAGNIIAIPTCAQFDEMKNLCVLGQIELRDTSTGLPIRETLHVHHNPSFYLAFVPNKDELFSISCTTLPDCKQAEAIIIDTVTGKQLLRTLPAIPLPFGILPKGIISGGG